MLPMAQHYSCTTDIWTSRTQHVYVGLTVHYLEFSLQSHLLETKEFPDSHSGVNIASEMDKVFRVGAS